MGLSKDEHYTLEVITDEFALWDLDRRFNGSVFRGMRREDWHLRTMLERVAKQRLLSQALLLQR